MNVYDPTETGGVVDQELRNISITVGPVSSNTGTIRDAISVTEVSAFAPNTSGQLATDNALTYSAE